MLLDNTHFVSDIHRISILFMMEIEDPERESELLSYSVHRQAEDDEHWELRPAAPHEQLLVVSQHDASCVPIECCWK